MTYDSKKDGGRGGKRPTDRRTDRPASDRPYKSRSDERGDAPARAKGDRPFGDKKFGAKKFGEKKFGDKPSGGRSFGDKKFGDKKFGGRDDRPARPYGDRPYGDRPDRNREDRPARSFGDRPRPPRDGDDRAPRRDFGDRPPRRDFGDRPSRPYGDRPDRNREDRPARSFGDRPRPPRDGDDRAPRRDFGDRPPRRDFGDRPPRRDFGDRPPRPYGDRPERGERSERPQSAGFRPRYEDKSRSTMSDRGDRPQRFGDKPRFGDKSRFGDRPRSDRPQSGGGKRDFIARDRSGDEAPAPRKGFRDRIAKVMARAGLCSRREAEEWIEAGRVSVNDEVLTSPALDVTERDKILVDGTPLPMRERTRLFLYHKPAGLVTTAWDPEGRPTVFAALPAGLPRVVTIGRLDINTEGLLLLTNDGGLSRVIALPETGWLRRYRVRAYGSITQADLDTLQEGITIEGIHYGPIEAHLQREQGDNVWLTLGLREGKNREVKKILDHFGLQVNRLIRLSFGPFQLNDLPEGAVEEVRTAILKDQLGETLAQEAEVDFDAPVFVYEDEDFHPRKRETSYRESIPGKPDRKDRFAGRDAPQEQTEEEAPRPKRRAPTEPLRSVWRASDEEVDGTPKQRTHKPRRGENPQEARQESGARAHERAGRIKTPKGGDVLVEKVVREKTEDLPVRAPRKPRPEEGDAPQLTYEDRPPRRDFGDRPRPPRDDGDRPPRRDFGDRPRPPRDGGDRPPRRDFGDRPRPPRDGGDRPPRRDFGDRPRPPRDGGDRPPRRDGGDRPRPPRDGAPRNGGGPRSGPRGGSGGPRPPRRNG